MQKSIKTGRGSNILSVRSKGSPKARPPPQFGVKWKQSPLQEHGLIPRCESTYDTSGLCLELPVPFSILVPTEAEVHRIIEDQAMEIEELKTELNSAIQREQQIEAEVLKLQTRMSLRNNAPSTKSTPHYIPGVYSGDRGEKNGRPIILETLQHVASVCGSGGQFSKV